MDAALDLSRTLNLSWRPPDASAAEPEILLVLVGVLVLLAAGRTIVVLARLIGLLLRSVAQLAGSLLLLLFCFGLLAAWGCDRIDLAGTSVMASPTGFPAALGVPGADDRPWPVG